MAGGAFGRLTWRIRSTLSLNLRQMEVLEALMLSGSLTRGAERLNVSQPAVSRMLRQMEQQLGFALFAREHGRLLPTPEATALAKEIDGVVFHVKAVKRLSHALRKGAGRIIRFGVVPSLTSAFLPAPFQAVLAAHPKIRLVVKTSEPTQVEANVISGDYHLGLVQWTRRRLEFAATELCHAPFVCVLPRDHPLASLPALGPHHLADESLISGSDITPAGEQLDEAFQAAGVERKVSVQTSYSGLAVDMVEGGLGIALTDPFALRQPWPDRLVVRPFVPTLLVKPQVLVARGRVLSRIERLIVHELKVAGRKWCQAFRGRQQDPPPSVADGPRLTG